LYWKKRIQVYECIEMNMNKILAGLTIIAFIGGWGVSFGNLFGKASKNEDQVKEIKEEVKEAKQEIDENENINLQQMIIIERTVKLVDKLEAKLEK